MTKLIRLLYYLIIPVLFTVLLDLSWSEFLVVLFLDVLISYRVERISDGRF